MRVVAPLQPVEKHLLDWLVVGQHHVADRVPAHKMAHFLGKILGMVAATLKRLSHEDNLQAGLMVQILGIFDVPHENEISKAVHFAIGPQHLNGFFNVAIRK